MPAKESLPPGFDKLLDDLYFRLEERDRWAEHIIRFLIAANGGGIAVVMAYAGVLTNLGRPVTGLFLGLVAFSVGLWLVGVQLWTAAHFVRVGRQKLRPLMEGDGQEQPVLRTGVRGDGGQEGVSLQVEMVPALDDGQFRPLSGRLTPQLP